MSNFGKGLIYGRGMRAYIEVEIRRNGSAQARSTLRKQVGMRPLIFSRNVKGRRVELPMSEQWAAFERTFDEVNKAVQNPISEAWQKEQWGTHESPAPEPTPKAPKPAPKAPKTPAPDHALPEPYRTMMQRVGSLRKFVKDRNGFDHLDSMRLTLDMTKALRVGLPLDGLLYSATLSWQQESREQAGVREFDHASWRHSDDGAHGISPWVAKLIEADLLVWLGGPAGTGKSTAARWTAEKLGMRYGEINLAGALPSALKGKDRLKEFVDSVFPDFYSNGGLLCLEEIDTAHPTVIPVINNALANDEFHNDADNKTYTRHSDFRLIATGNTWGTGATGEYNARNKLDGATLDRFRVGRVHTGHDQRLETYLVRKMVGV